MSDQLELSSIRSKYHLIPTSLKGVYSFVPPPKGTDLTKASKSTLMKHGVLMRKPDPIREPKLFDAWTKFVTEIWTEEKFIPPVFGPSPNIPRSPKIRKPNKNVPETFGQFYNNQWAGLVVVGNWVGVIGQWTVPTVSEPNPPTPVAPASDYGGGWQSASWVGLDGGGGLIAGTSTSDVLQAGVAQNAGTTSELPSYYAWYEWYVELAGLVAEDPAFQYVLPVPITSIAIQPGDVVCVVVQYVKHVGDEIGDPIPSAGPYSFGGVLLTNITTNQAVSLYLEPPPGASFAGDSAEWIMECPVGPDGGTLPQFTPLHFENAGACDVNDAPPGAEVGVELQNGVQCFFVNPDGFLGNNVSGGVGVVDITYMDD